MSKNQVQFQAGYSLPELFHDYGTEEQCRQSLFDWKWPQGFVCPKCGSSSFCTLKSRNVYPCNHCHHQTSLTSGTILASTNLPLTQWFLAIHLITQSKTGLSALELKRQIGVSYNTAWSMKQKIMQVMKGRDDSQPLSGTIQLDDVYWGGERHGGSRGRVAENKIPYVAAVSTNEKGHLIAMSMTVVKGFRLTEISKWVQQHLPRYLAEFCYRFNRRFHLEDMLPRFAYIAVRTPPMPNRLLKMAENYG